MSRKKSPTKSLASIIFSKNHLTRILIKTLKKQLELKTILASPKPNLKMTSGLLHEKIPIIPSRNKVEFSYTVHSRLGKIESMSGELYQLE
jgi:hypothetical protein